MIGKNMVSQDTPITAMKPMSVAFLLTQSLESPSGLGRYFPLAKGLVRLGHQVEIYALHPDIESLSVPFSEQDGVKIQYVAPMHVRKINNQKHYYPASKLVSLATIATLQLTRAALTTQAKLLYLCKPHPMNSIAGLTAKFLSRKWICLDCDDYEAASGNFAAEWQKQMVVFFEKKMPGQVRLITTNTYFLRQKLILWGAPAERIFFLPNGVDRQRFQQPNLAKISSLRQQLVLEGRNVILYIGSMSLASHAVDLLLQAFPEVLAACPRAVLLMVGGGEDIERLQRQCRALGIEHAVRWVGRVAPEQAVYYYHLAHVSVDPVYDNDAARSRSPLKMFESWACGTPFVSADIGDRKLLSGSPPAAVLTEPGDPEALSAGILQVIQKPPIAEALRQSGLNNVEGYYWDHLSDKAERFLQEFGVK